MTMTLVYTNLQPAGRFCGQAAAANSWAAIENAAGGVHTKRVHVMMLKTTKYA